MWVLLILLKDTPPSSYLYTEEPMSWLDTCVESNPLVKPWIVPAPTPVYSIISPSIFKYPLLVESTTFPSNMTKFDVDATLIVCDEDNTKFVNKVGDISDSIL